MNIEILKKELRYRTARSGGNGGQNVNKVETKVEVIFAIQDSLALDDFEKSLIMSKLSNKINAEGQLQLTSQDGRSQLLNKHDVLQKLIGLLDKSLQVQTPRKQSKIPKGVIAARKKAKAHRSIIKSNRKKVSKDYNIGADLF